MEKVIDIYEKKINHYKEQLEKLNKSYNVISILRLLTIVITAVFMYLAYKNSYILYLILVVFLGVILFLYLAKIHEGQYNKKVKISELVKINENEISRNNGKWKKFKDKGEEYLDLKHSFINDLDVFGKNSLFQWINTTKTIYGRSKLSALLKMKKLPNKDEVLNRQESLKELAEKLDFRQELIASLKVKKNNNDEESFLNQWVKNRNEKIFSLKVRLLKIILPVINFLILILVIANVITWHFIIISLIISFLFLRTINKEVLDGLLIFEELKYKIKSYVDSIELIEKENFKTESLNKLKSNFENNKKASEKLNDLQGITSWLYDRGNAFYIIFNTFLLWDYQMIYKLEKWRIANGDELINWLETLGEFEALISLSSLIYNNPNWCVPSITEDKHLEGTNVSHPILGESAVGNSFSITDKKRVLLITGSNMSGKSTFLRTVGFSVIMSYLGLNVRGESFCTPILNIYTCMRTADNLEESISSFYAEILRIKSIVEGSNRGEKILFLLDEIFKGTNSLDRHLGAEVLINQLLKGDTIGLVSTHDLELCEMESEDNRIGNYNFREYYENNKLRFDYKLRKGVSKTRNARYLMKMAGIDI
ncbi:MutS family DNA mismatch repair protein [Clostridium tarantellae]|uniref:DNA mismatch repair protein MutS n=1 Tax=Clostridium tarantellae TaxID=39493 RepID=A0A6I1MJ79_9CLOT|nr:MutS family DNA mismatch repair protein [Clostridium tarantellae]MPQ43586.1 DNA mismatch repair protein MutS [Clostridium tarantellae]